MAIQKNVTINRKEYERIKKYDRTQMDTFIQSVYKSGYEDGKKSVPGIDISKISDILLTIKGIGEKKAKDIVAALERGFEI
nr:MAG TPA: DNA-directed RNA polymerase subunit alpha [Caudoviricetes sp.]DAO71900.1 MAG TPA: DNA-directed RNA polymerase subunit alpha [Caudoviricetes sp.]